MLFFFLLLLLKKLLKKTEKGKKPKLNKNIRQHDLTRTFHVAFPYITNHNSVLFFVLLRLPNSNIIVTHFNLNIFCSLLFRIVLKFTNQKKFSFFFVNEKKNYEEKNKSEKE